MAKVRQYDSRCTGKLQCRCRGVTLLIPRLTSALPICYVGANFTLAPMGASFLREVFRPLSLWERIRVRDGGIVQDRSPRRSLRQGEGGRIGSEKPCNHTLENL
jgi:hypothetical protein